jgi:hypothetical protein
MSERRRLENRRGAMTFDFEVSGLQYTCTISRFADGRLGEIFLGNHKVSSAADVNARDGAVVCSIALQHGADLEVIRRALSRNSDDSASGPLGTALDLIAADRGAQS